MDVGRRQLLEEAEGAFAQMRWADAFRMLSVADGRRPLEPAGLEQLAWSAALAGEDDQLLGALERLYHQRLEAGEVGEAALWAFWLGFRLTGLGEHGRAGAWRQRSRRLCEDSGTDCVAAGYLMLPEAYRALAAGELDAAHEMAARGAAIGERLGDADLVAFARHLLGRVLVVRGEVAGGLALLDEAMVIVTSGALRPQAAGIVYCSVIDGCRDIYSLQRAHEWTRALTRWCEEQPELVTFTGECRVARAEMLVLHGEWHDAVAEAERAGERPPRWSAQRVMAAADYQRAEVARLRGNYGAAERGYAAAARAGSPRSAPFRQPLPQAVCLFFRKKGWAY